MLTRKRIRSDRTGETPKSPGERAGWLFDHEHNCAQAVLGAATGVEDAEWLAAAQAFGGGIGGTKCLCGAVAGGVMALGMRGKGKKAARLMESFRKRYQVTCCKGLSAPFRWMSREHRANCRNITVETADMVVDLLGK